MPRRLLRLVLTLLVSAAAHGQPALRAHTLPGADGNSPTLSLPRDFDITVALTGLHRVRFFAQSPDHRLFVTDMYDRTDNTRGAVYILDGWDPARHTFARAIPYLQHLRNPNNLAFYTDAQGQSWLYLPLTDRLLRFHYSPGDIAPSSPPQVLAHYPAYGLDYKYGGWHLTRTVAFGKLRNAAGTLEDKLFVSVGSSCNACEEKEPIRATLSVMNPDGTAQHIVAKNLRNAVGLAWSAADHTLYATNMGDDQLGDRAPDDPFLAISAQQLEHALATKTPLDYGWPYCYYDGSTAHPDPHFGALPRANCHAVPAAFTTFAAHSSPLGIALFPATDPHLGNTLGSSFLVALHGAGHPRIGAGYKLVRFTAADRTPHDFLTGFLVQRGTHPRVLGRPCGIFRIAPDTFLLTDDIAGRIYAIYPAAGTSKPQ